MAQFSFGSGTLWGTPLTDSTGSSIAVPTPVQFGTVQEVTMDFSFEQKELIGQNQFPVAIARGKGKITGKAKTAQIQGLLFHSLVFGQTLTDGIISDVYDTTGTAIPSSSPYTITPTVPNSGTFLRDLGVKNWLGLPMIRVASSPASGEYAVSNVGVYTFNSSDKDKTVFINYQYSAASTAGKIINIKNVAMGAAPTFKMDFTSTFQGKTITVTLNNCTSTKLSFQTKLDDFVVPEFDFGVQADDQNNIGTIATSE
jgi:hypothetical protein